LPIDRAVLDHATVLRAKYGLKTPDAIHVATACVAKASVFITGDADLARCSEVPFEILTQKTPT
jgi:predicted nucleic acid-binding protein